MLKDKVLKKYWLLFALISFLKNICKAFVVYRAHSQCTSLYNRNNNFPERSVITKSCFLLKIGSIVGIQPEELTSRHI